MPPRAKAKTEALDYEDLVRKRDAFVTSMTLLRNAADECSRTGLAFFELVAQAPGMPADTITYARGMSMPPSGRAHTEEPETKKRKRNVKPKDPNAPKKPATPYFLFCSAGREKVKNDLGPDTKYPDIQAELKTRWEALTDEERKSWSNVYHDKFDQWKTEYNNYTAGKEASEAAALADDEAAAAAAASEAQAGFTAVNNAPIAESDEDSEMVDAVETKEKQEESLSEEETEASELTPPPAQKTTKPAPAARKKAADKKAAPKEAAAPAEKKPRKPRAKKADKEKEPEPEPEAEVEPEQEAEADEPEPEPEPEKKRERRKRRKSGAE